MDDKEELLEAINNYEVLTIKQRSILRTLVSIEINSIATITIPTLSRVTEITSGAIYKALKVFSDEGYIKVIDDNSRKLCKFRINLVKLNEVVEIYEKMKKVYKK